jgi:hypothetical protein
MSELVVYRDFGDDTEEIGILTPDGWVHVGDFEYYLPMAYNWYSDLGFTILGTL